MKGSHVTGAAPKGWSTLAFLSRVLPAKDRDVVEFVNEDLDEVASSVRKGLQLETHRRARILVDLSGQILLVFEDRSGLALVDLLLHQPIGTAASWGELEQSAAQETTNIVGRTYLNALAAHLPGKISRDSPARDELVPTPPTFLREFAGSLLEFVLMEQALELDQVLLIHTSFTSSPQELNLNWSLLFIPDRASLHALATALTELETH